MNEQTNRDWWTIKAMRTYGGGFVKKLAEAADQADSNNLARIKKAWPEYWGEYEGMGRSLERSSAHVRIEAEKETMDMG
jgi:hypothetical protein